MPTLRRPTLAPRDLLFLLAASVIGSGNSFFHILLLRLDNTEAWVNGSVSAYSMLVWVAGGDSLLAMAP